MAAKCASTSQWPCAHELLPKDEAWKHRPPYTVPGVEEFGPVRWRGRCHCGRVTYSLNREKPVDAKYCHCRGCQLMHGAPFQWATIFHKSDLTFTQGVHGLEFYSSSHYSREYEIPTKVSCSFCRTPIMDEGRNMCLLFPESIEVEDSEEARKRFKSIFQVSYVVIHPALHWIPLYTGVGDVDGSDRCHIFYKQRLLEIPDGKAKWAGMNGSSQLLDDFGNAIESS